jgi:hypothetical protein
MPDDLSGLSRVELDKGEAACEWLLDLHREHQVAGGELPARLGALLSEIRMVQQDRAGPQLEETADRADPPRVAGMMARVSAQLAGLPRASAANIALSARLLGVAMGDPAVDLTDEQANFVFQLVVGLVSGDPVAVAALELTGAMLNTRWPDGPPAGYLAVAGLDEVSWRELAARRLWLLAAVGAAGPGADHPGVRAGALALAAVIAELDARARNYAADPDSPRWCQCGYSCQGLAAIDNHLDQFPDLDDDHHHEISRPPGNDADHTCGAHADQETNHVPPGSRSGRQAAA